jgi:Phosphotransferase enzyme family
MSDDALISVARLLRGYHDAVDEFGTSHPGLTWSTELADPAGGSVLCHNDLCPENVVFRDGRAVALLDFDYAGPGSRVWDVVATAAMWAPPVVGVVVSVVGPSCSDPNHIHVTSVTPDHRRRHWAQVQEWYLDTGAR